MEAEPEDRAGDIRSLFLPSTLVLASAPLPFSSFTRALVTAHEIPWRQVLFGWEAALRAFATALGQSGQKLYIVPAPEMLSGESGRHQILHITQSGRTERMVHLRFGPPIMARLVKPAENWHVLLETSPFLPTLAGDHPLGGENVLPAAFARVCAFEKPSPPLRRLDGEEPDFEMLDPSLFALRDLAAESGKPSPSFLSPSLGWGPESGLIAHSFAEFDAALWEEEPPPVLRRLSDWRGMIIAREVTWERNESRWTLAALPWNLAHPASLIPDLVLKLARSAMLSIYGCHLVLLPYNETMANAGAVRELVGRCREAASSHPQELRHLFLARYRGGGALRNLRSLFDVIWLETALPDLAWTVQRLGVFTAPLLLIGQFATAAGRARAVVRGDERLEIITDDAFGTRHFATMTLSERTLAFLLRETLRCRRSPASFIPPPPPSSRPSGPERNAGELTLSQPRPVF